jgi:hypothetical protein
MLRLKNFSVAPNLSPRLSNTQKRFGVVASPSQAWQNASSERQLKSFISRTPPWDSQGDQLDKTEAKGEWLGKIRDAPVFDDPRNPCGDSGPTSATAPREETLFRDFLFVLEKNRLLEHNEKSLLKTLKAPLALFAIAHMHQTSVSLEDGWSADLWGGHSDDQLQVFASAPTWPGSGGSTVLVAAPIFSTSLRPVEWCAPELLSFPDNGNHWFCGIELTSEAKLVPL